MGTLITYLKNLQMESWDKYLEGVPTKMWESQGDGLFSMDQ